MRQVALIAGITFLLTGIAALETHADFDPATVFSMRCGSCHTVGRGDDIGPDLSGVTERRDRDWLVSFIRASQQVILAGDPVATELFERFGRQKMPDHDYTPEEIDLLLAYIAAGGPGDPQPMIRPAHDATDAEIALGRDLFFGQVQLSRGGASCSSCHTVGGLALAGGTLGGNLSDAFSRYYDVELTKVLMHPSKPLMDQHYASHPLTLEECFALKAFLFQVSQGLPEEDLFPRTFAFLGFASGALILGLVGISRRGRGELDPSRQEPAPSERP